MFAPGGDVAANGSSQFLKAFGNTATNHRFADSAFLDEQSRRDPRLSLPMENPSFLDFEAPSNTESSGSNGFSSATAAGLQGWSNDMNTYPLSPPDSSSYSPKDWSFDSHQTIPANILTNTQPLHTREKFGQVTPTEDQDESQHRFNFQLCKQSQHESPQNALSTPSKKRKRNNAPSTCDGNQTHQARKSSSRGPNKPSVDISKPEDFRRSKFLERNRVAASKCRQKKKEWTQNLEVRARELQKSNGSLRMMIDSIRDEVLFLKGEMLQHKHCGCTQIQEFLESGAHSVQDVLGQDTMFKRETSSTDSVRSSRAESPAEEYESRRSFSPNAQGSSIADDENVLEALLTNSMNPDTSDENVALQPQD